MAWSGVLTFHVEPTAEYDVFLSKYFSTAKKHFIFMERSTTTYKIGVLGRDNKKAVFENVVDGLTVIKCTNLSLPGRVYGFICSDRTQKLTTNHKGMTTFLIRYLRDRHTGRGGEIYLSWPVSRSDVPARLCEG